MKISSAFPSKYLKASDLEGKHHKYTMTKVTVEEVGDDERPVLYFREAEKGLVLNKTNAGIISALFDDDTEGWFGQEIVVYPTQTEFGGKMVDAIRVRAVKRQAASPQPAVAEGKQRIPSPRLQSFDEANPPPRTTIEEDLNDEVPF